MAWMRGFAFLVAVILLQAGVPASAKAVKIAPALAAPESVTPTFTDEEYQKAMAAAKKARKIASDSDTFDYASAYSDEAKDIHNRIIGTPVIVDGKDTGKRTGGIQNSQDIVKLINDLEAGYENLKNDDARFMAAYWIALKPWRGFIHRARPLVENHNLSQSAIVTFLRATYAGINVFLPDSPAWQAGFDYMTKPAKDLGAKINTEEKLYYFAGTDILPAIDKFNSRITKMNFSKKPIYFDNQLVFRTANFVSSRDRHVRLGEAERLSVLSAGLLTYSNLSGSMAYSWDGFFEAADQVSKVYGFTSSLKDGSMTAEWRFGEIRKQANLFHLRPGGETWTKTVAFPKFKEGLRSARASWAWLKAMGGDSEAQKNLFDPRAFIPATRIIDTSFDNIESMLKDTGVASAVVNGEVIDINFSKLFNEPPQDMKAFFPKTFAKGENKPTDPVTGEQYRNYNLGNPTGWDVGVYTSYFPSVKSDADVKKTARVLNQAWGGWLLGLPITGMTF